MNLVLLLVLACQDSEYVQKLDKVKYNLAVRSCREAEKRLDSDEGAAIERLTRIIEDPELSKKECTLYVQQTDQYDPPYLFLPYQYRARARLSLAAKSRTPAEKKAYLEEAIRDFEESVRRNVKSSQAYLETARADLKRVSAGEPAPAPAPPAEDLAGRLRSRMAPLLAENRFKSAKALIDGDRSGLSEKDRGELAALVDRSCRNYLTEEMRRFRLRLQSVASVAELREMSKDEFEVAFDLPSADEVVIPHPSYDWARRQREAFREVWSGRKPSAALFVAAQDASRMEEGGDSPWFRMSETLAYQDLQVELDRRIGESLEAPKAKREVLLGQVQTLLGSWNDFLSRLDPALRKRLAWLEEQGKTLRASADRQPRELADLDLEDLRSCFDRYPVQAELLSREGKLRKLESGGALALEARQKLYTLLVAAQSYRLLLDGRSEDEIVRMVQGDLEKLGRAGGATDPDRFGPRIRKVLESLR